MKKIPCPTDRDRKHGWKVRFDALYDIGGEIDRTSGERRESFDESDVELVIFAMIKLGYCEMESPNDN